MNINELLTNTPPSAIAASVMFFVVSAMMIINRFTDRED